MVRRAGRSGGRAMVTVTGYRLPVVGFATGILRFSNSLSWFPQKQLKVTAKPHEHRPYSRQFWSDRFPCGTWEVAQIHRKEEMVFDLVRRANRVAQKTGVLRTGAAPGAPQQCWR